MINSASSNMRRWNPVGTLDFSFLFSKQKMQIDPAAIICFGQEGRKFSQQFNAQLHFGFTKVQL